MLARERPGQPLHHRSRGSPLACPTPTAIVAPPHTFTIGNRCREPFLRSPMRSPGLSQLQQHSLQLPLRHPSGFAAPSVVAAATTTAAILLLLRKAVGGVNQRSHVSGCVPPSQPRLDRARRPMLPLQL
jgi:hypothetical protein